MAGARTNPQIRRETPVVDAARSAPLGPEVDADRRRGRGAQANSSARYEPTARVAFDDGWQSLEDLPPFKTTISTDTSRKVITRNDSPDIGFDRSINPYRG